MLSPFELMTILKIISETLSIYLYEIKQKLYEMFGVHVSVPTLCRALKYMGCSRKIITHVAMQQSDEMRAKFIAKISFFDPGILIW